MSDLNILLVIAVVSGITILIRFAPFIIFDRGNTLPSWIEYLGKILPPAVMSVLLVYCLRGIDITSGNYGLPELISVAVVVLLHVWKRNTLLSIGVGTALYMIFVQVLFA